ncbi:polysaccharide biosynthesis protein [Ilumatobacter nonamiensis]|uniref:polysaccharide biosynthesis protein n=1 Tax=Ilumatobacter nonamiensis TaxID=467093 RepID=UPI00034B463F|nr:nucleoside-diphosphate sugar epimerase/dehydratase [Ilumatobacter nonamiensis]
MIEYNNFVREDHNRIVRAWARVAGRTVRMRSDILMVVLDATLALVAFAAMLLLRFDGAVPTDRWSNFWEFAPIAVAVVLLSNFAWGLYGQVWKHASLFEARQLVMSGATILTVLVALEWGTRDIPVSVVVTGSILTMMLMGLVRFQSRLFSFRRHATDGGMRVVVIGAGEAGVSLVADMQRNEQGIFRPVAVIDEDSTMHGKSFMGVQIVGSLRDLSEVVAAAGANLAVYTDSGTGHPSVEEAATAAEQAGIPMKIVPSLSATMAGKASVRDIRDLRIEDLLGRDQISTDLDAVCEMLRGRSVLVTGAGGSIGSELARQIATFEPSKLVLLDHDETHLFDIASEISGDFAVQCLADVRNAELMRRVFAKHRPSVVFHAAAHKHVPLLEKHPTEAAATNVIGTENVLDAAEAVGVEQLVFISTDKAVYPSSVMGSSKRIGEQLVISRAPDHAAYCAVRFGNVLGSRGSVVPTFMKQIQAGGPVTVTDPRMTRYFMSIPEAVQLVLQAGALSKPGRGGDVFMLDMGEPVVILELAERMIRLAGLQPGKDILIDITGMRPGEKLAEELVSGDELSEPTAHPSINRVMTNRIAPSMLHGGVHGLRHMVTELDDEHCGDQLRALAHSELATADLVSSELIEADVLQSA